MLRIVLILSLAVLLTLPVVGCGSSSSGGVAAPSGPPPVIDMIIGTRQYDAGAGVYIFRDVLNTSAIAADVVLDDPGSGIDNGGRIDVWNETLIVGSQGSNQIRIFRDIPTLMSGDAPDVVLSGFSTVTGVYVSPAGDIYACDRNNDQVRIYRDITTLVTGDGPDATLSGCNGAVEARIAAGRLFVACRYDNSIRVYDNAAGLVGGEAPDEEIPLSEPRRLTVHNGVLWACPSYTGGIFGWSDPATVTGATPADRAVFGLVETDDRADLAFSDSTMWIGCNPNNNDEGISRVDISSALVTAPEATIGEDAMGDDEVYDVQQAQNYLFATVRYSGYALFWNNAEGFSNDQLPTGYVFDARMSEPKEIRLIER